MFKVYLLRKSSFPCLIVGVGNIGGDMTFVLRTQRPMDISICQYKQSLQSFRGPKRSFDRPYFACIGGTDTFGQHAVAPYARSLEDIIQKPCINLGILQGGLDAIRLDPAVQDIANRAERVIFHAVGAHAQSNKYYKVHPRRNDRFITALDPLYALYPDVDFTEFTFTKHMLTFLDAHDHVRFQTVRDHLIETWQSRMIELCQALPRKPILLWTGHDNHDLYTHPLGAEPVFISQEALEPIKRYFAAVIRCALPQSARVDKFSVFTELDQTAHDVIAQCLHEGLNEKGLG